jgi:hypothetical protein
MPKQLTQKDLESGAVIVRKCTPRAMAVPAYMGPEVVDVLKEITAAISKLVSLHTMTKALIEKPVVQPDHSLILDRMAEVQFLTQQTMEAMANNMVEAIRRDVPTYQAPTIQDIKLKVTERDAWGRIVSLDGRVEKK